jgi:acyl-CoA reductase-like NAD-dependent aldehyde dehydrogenase
MYRTETGPGAPGIAEMRAEVEPTPRHQIDAALEDLNHGKDRWLQTGVDERIALLDEVIAAMKALAEDWAALGLQAKGIPPDTPFIGDEWSSSAVMFRRLRMLRQSLAEIKEYGKPIIPGPITQRPDGQVIAQVFPRSIYDRLLFRGITGEVWMGPEMTMDRLVDTQANSYRRRDLSGGIALILAAGNLAVITPGDLLHKLFIENRVVICKTSPVNAYLGPLLEEAFRALIEPGFVRIVHGGVEEGEYLAHHPLVDELHLTGSAATHDAIVFGPGEEGRRRKAQRQPLLTKPFTSELGSVSPVIVVPGPWDSGDIDYQSRQLATTLAVNGGFNCLTTRVIIQHAGWERRSALLDGIRAVLGELETHPAYYPGAHDRHAAFLQQYPQAELYGQPADHHLPWTLIPDVDPAHPDDLAFTTEAFCSLFAETALQAGSVPEFIDRAAQFANERLWGSLTVTLLAHPDSLADPEIAAAVERAVAELRYGSIGVNLWGALAFFMGTTTLGGFPGHDLYDIQSGRGIVGNALMFDQPQKSVVRGPFRWPLANPTLITHRGYSDFIRQYAYFELEPSPSRLPGLVWTALRG